MQLDNYPHDQTESAAIDTTGLFWAERIPDFAASARDALTRCARDRKRVPDRTTYKRWLRTRQRRGEYPPTVFLIELVFNGWELALYDAGLVASAEECGTVREGERRGC